MNFFKKNIGIVFIIIFAILASLPLFHSGFYPMHDDEQIARLFDLNQALITGQFPPRIAPNLGFGYGYPFFNFYPSFAYYVGEIFHLIGFGYILSTKLMLFTGFLLAAYFIYLLSKEFFGKSGGIIAAAAYTFAPYRAVDIYVRGAYAEFFSFVFLPLIFWSTYKLEKTNKSTFIVPVALSVGFLILSHNLIALMSMPFIAIWLAYLLLRSSDRGKFFLRSAVGFILGFGLSAFFWLPSYLEMNYTLVRILTSELANYNLHFVCIHQLFNSAWGYGGSIPDCHDGLSFEVGKVHLAASALAIILVGIYSFKKKIDAKHLIILLFFGMLAASMFLTTRESKIIWDALPPLWYVQFPWRFLAFSTLFSSIIAGSIVLFFKGRNARLTITVFLVAAFILFNISDFKPEKFINASDNDYTNIQKIRWDTSSLAYEYVPGKIKTKKSKDNTTVVDITKNEIKSSPYQVIEGEIAVNVVEDLPQEKIFYVSSKSGGVLRLSSFAFPGWEVLIDNKKISYTANNKLLLIDIVIPEGQHTVRSEFRNTPVRTVSNFISIISVIGVCFAGILNRRQIYEKT